MPTASAAVLSVRVSASERALLEAAAEQASTNLSDFVRRRALEAAETDLLNRRIVTIAVKDWARFESLGQRACEGSPGASKTVQDSPRLAEVSSDTTAAFTPPRPMMADDDTAAFDCGRDALNNWFRRHAWRNQELGVSRTTVICDAEAGSIVGYVSLSTAQVERAWLPKAQQRNRPDPLPAILLSQLAVDLRWQRQGIARSLMFYALTTAVRLSDQVGCSCVLTHPLDDDVRALYGAFGFEDLPFDPARSMAVRIADLVRSGFGAAD